MALGIDSAEEGSAMSHFRSLRVRLVLFFVLVALVPVGTAALLVHRATEDAFRSYSTERSKADAQVIVSQVDALTGFSAVVVDANQAVIAGSVGFSDGAATGGMVESTVPVADDAVSGSFSVQSVSPGEAGTSIGGFNTGEGEITLSLPGLPDQQFLDAMNRALYAGVGLAALGALVMAIVLTRHILTPVETLTSAARGMAAGDLNRRVAVQSRGEIGELAEAFNSMADNRSRQEGLRRNLVNDVAHELRTPLSNLQGYLELLREGLAPATPAIIAVLHDESLLLSHLVTDLQDLALVEAGQLPLNPEEAALTGPITGAMDALRPQATARGITLTSELPEEMPEVVVDIPRLNQILRNLLRNAIVHSKSGGTVQIDAVARPEAVAVSVHDTGIGISPEHLPYIFDRFYRVDPARARSTGGTGLGLAIVKHLVEASGGSIDVKSEVAVGTTVTFTLPRATAPGASVA